MTHDSPMYLMYRRPTKCPTADGDNGVYLDDDDDDDAIGQLGSNWRHDLLRPDELRNYDADEMTDPWAN